MSCLPPWIAAAIASFAPLFSRRVWAHTQVLLAAALRGPGALTRRSSTASIAASATRAGPAWRRGAYSWRCSLLRVVRRWWPERAIVAVADSGYAALAFLAACGSWRRPVTVVTRLRLDAAL